MSKAFNYGHYHNMGPSRINCYLGEFARDKFELLYPVYKNMKQVEYFKFNCD